MHFQTNCPKPIQNTKFMETPQIFATFRVVTSMPVDVGATIATVRPADIAFLPAREFDP